jgi:ATP-dependent DNA ligase
VELDKIYKLDVSGSIRVWWAEVNEDGFWRTHSGTLNGEIVTSEWKYAEPKSQFDSYEQAIFNANSARTKKLKVDYRESIDDIEEVRSSLIRPMLAHKYPGWIGECYAQPKLDGMRCLANKDGLWSRNNRRIIAAPHIEAHLKVFFQDYPHVVIDGELYNHTLHNDFNTIMSIARKTKPTFEDLERSKEMIQYYIFDMCDTIATKAIFEDRWNFLQKELFDIYYDNSITRNSAGLVQTPTKLIKDEEELDIHFWKLLEQGYEGQIVRFNTVYEEKRTYNLLKRKEFLDQEYDLVDIEEGEGNWEGLAARAVCRLDDGRTFGAGITGTQEFCYQLLREKDKYDVVTVKYHALTPDGKPRFPKATKFWEKNMDAIENRITKRKDLFA